MSRCWEVPLAQLVLEDDDLAAVMEAYRSGWLTMGPRNEGFESDFAEYTGAPHAVAVSSGTAALHLMCVAIGLGPGDEVVVPSLTFVASANAIAYTGAKPVFADIAGLAEPWMSLAACESAMTDRTRAVMAVAYGGHAGEIEALQELCAGASIVLLEDAAHAAGSRLNGRHLGNFGRAGAFSMFSNKNLAVGEGGVLVTSDDELAARSRLLRSHGMTSLTWDRDRGHASDYDVIAEGFNYRMDEPRAALAACRLARLDRENDRRRQLDARYRMEFADLDLTLPLRPFPGLSSSHHLFTVVLPVDVDRATLRSQLADAGIQTSMHYPPLHLTALYRDGQSLPVTEEYASRSITLPMFAHMTDAQQDRVVEEITRALAKARSAAAVQN